MNEALITISAVISLSATIVVGVMVCLDRTAWDEEDR